MLYSFNFNVRDPLADRGHAEVIIVECNEVEARKCLAEHLEAHDRLDLTDKFCLKSVRAYNIGVVLSNVEQGTEALKEIQLNDSPKSLRRDHARLAR